MKSPPNRPGCRSAAFCIFSAALAITALLPVRGAERAKIVLISGEYEYLSNFTFPALKDCLVRDFGLDVTYLERTVGEVVQREKTAGEVIPELEAIEDADLLVLGIRRTTLPEAQLNRFKRYFRPGRAVVAVRTTSHAFENWKAWDPEVLGGNYHSHYMVTFLDRNEPHIVYGTDRRDSGRAARRLHELGFRWVYDYAGGFAEWKAGGNPIGQ